MQENSLCGCFFQKLFFKNGLSKIYLGLNGVFIHVNGCEYRVLEPHKNIWRAKLSHLHSFCAVIHFLSISTETNGTTFRLSVSKILTPNDLPRSHRESVAPSPGSSEDNRVNWMRSEGLSRWQRIKKNYKGTHCCNISSLQICKHTPFLGKLVVSIKLALGQVYVSRPALVCLVTWADTDLGSTAGITFG